MDATFCRFQQGLYVRLVADQKYFATSTCATMRLNERAQRRMSWNVDVQF